MGSEYPFRSRLYTRVLCPTQRPRSSRHPRLLFNSIQVTGSVNFAGQALLSAALNFSAGGGITGLSSLSIGEGGLQIEGPLKVDSDSMFEGSVTVAGAVMGRGPYMDSSDARLKAEIEDISGVDAVDIVRRLR